MCQLSVDYKQAVTITNQLILLHARSLLTASCTCEIVSVFELTLAYKFVTKIPMALVSLLAEIFVRPPYCYYTVEGKISTCAYYKNIRVGGGTAPLILDLGSR